MKKISYNDSFRNDTNIHGLTNNNIINNMRIGNDYNNYNNDNIKRHNLDYSFYINPGNHNTGGFNDMNINNDLLYSSSTRKPENYYVREQESKKITDYNINYNYGLELNNETIFRGGLDTRSLNKKVINSFTNINE